MFGCAATARRCRFPVAHSVGAKRWLSQVVDDDAKSWEPRRERADVVEVEREDGRDLEDQATFFEDGERAEAPGAA